MPRIQSTRKARFKAACARAGISQGQWATDNEVERSHLFKVLNNSRESIRLTEKIDAFIASVEQQVIRKAQAA